MVGVHPLSFLTIVDIRHDGNRAAQRRVTWFEAIEPSG